MLIGLLIVIIFIIKTDKDLNINIISDDVNDEQDQSIKEPKRFYDSNKILIGHGYGDFYETHLNIYKNINIKILEIGTWKGAGVAAF